MPRAYKSRPRIYTAKLNWVLDPELKSDLLAEAQVRGIPVCELVRLATKVFLESHGCGRAPGPVPECTRT